MNISTIITSCFLVLTLYGFVSQNLKLDPVRSQSPIPLDARFIGAVDLINFPYGLDHPAIKELRNSQIDAWIGGNVFVGMADLWVEPTRAKEAIALLKPLNTINPSPIPTLYDEPGTSVRGSQNARSLER